MNRAQRIMPFVGAHRDGFSAAGQTLVLAVAGELITLTFGINARSALVVIGIVWIAAELAATPWNRWQALDRALSQTIRLVHDGRLEWFVRGSGAVCDIQAPTIRTFRLHLDHDLLEVIRRWDLPTLDGACFTGQTLRQLNQSSLIEKHETSTMAFLFGCHDDVSGLFTSAPGRSDAHVRNALCAIGTLKNIIGVAPEHRLGLDRARELMTPGIASLLVQAIRERAVRITSDANDHGYLGTVGELHACWRVAWNLVRDDDWAIDQRSSVQRFLGQVFLADTQNRAAWGFANGRGASSPALAATYFGVKLLKYFDACTLTHRAEIARFIKLCWNDEIGAFASVPGARPTVVHSYLGLALCRELQLPTWEYRPRIIDFLGRCWTADTFSFVPFDAPNAYATRCAWALLTDSCEISLERSQAAGYRLEHMFFDPEWNVFRAAPRDIRIVDVSSEVQPLPPFAAFCYV